MKMDRRDFLGAGCAAAAAVFLPGCAAGRHREVPAVRAEVKRMVAAGLYAGIVCTSNRGDMYCEGFRTLSAPQLPMTENSLCDIASCGKPYTAALCALLYADGKLDPDAPFTEYLPEHVLAKENCRITLRDLATHSGGFDNAKPYMVPDVDRQMKELFAKRPVRPRGEKFQYACSNYVYLGFIVERLTGLDLDAAAKKMLWGPLGMTRTTWNTVKGDPDVVEFPSPPGFKPFRAIGEHNDVCAHYAPRPVGNGSIFTVCRDQMRFLEDLLHRERFPRAYYELLFAESFAKDGLRRSFGFDMAAPKSMSRVYPKFGYSPQAIGHTGSTGVGFVVDPGRDFAAVMQGNKTGDYDETMNGRMHLLAMMM